MSALKPLGIVVLAHAYPEQLAFLLSKLRHQQVRCYVHLDARTNQVPFDDALASLGPQAYQWLPRHRTTWAGPELVDASLDGIAAAVEDDCHHIVQISGQDLPLWPIDRIVNFFQNNVGRSFVDHFPLPDDRWRHGGKLRTECYTYDLFGLRATHVPRRFEVSLSWKRRLLNEALGLVTLLRPKRTFPTYLNAYGGSQWWNLDREAAEWVLAFVAAHPGYRRYHQHTAVADEIFFQSILLGTDFAGKHDVANNSLRYMRWEPGASHPEMISIEEFPELVAAQVPFARKFDLATARSFSSWLEDRGEATARSGSSHGFDEEA